MSANTFEDFHTRVLEHPEEGTAAVSTELGAMVPSHMWASWKDRYVFQNICTKTVFLPRTELMDITPIDYTTPIEIKPIVVYAAICDMCEKLNVDARVLLGFDNSNLPDVNFLLACAYFISIIGKKACAFVEQLHKHCLRVLVTATDIGKIVSRGITQQSTLLTKYAPKKPVITKKNISVRPRVSFDADPQIKRYELLASAMGIVHSQERSNREARKVLSLGITDPHGLKLIKNPLTLKILDDARKEIAEQSEVDFDDPEHDAERRKRLVINEQTETFLRKLNTITKLDFSKLLKDRMDNARMTREMDNVIGNLTVTEENQKLSEIEAAKEVLRKYGETVTPIVVPPPPPFVLTPQQNTTVPPHDNLFNLGTMVVESPQRSQSLRDERIAERSEEKTDQRESRKIKKKK